MRGEGVTRAEAALPEPSSCGWLSPGLGLPFLWLNLVGFLTGTMPWAGFEGLDTPLAEKHKEPRAQWGTGREGGGLEAGQGRGLPHSGGKESVTHQT